jgi:hypothetical protein
VSKAQTQIAEQPIPFASRMPRELLFRVRKEADRRGIKLYRAFSEMAENWLRENGKVKAK